MIGPATKGDRELITTEASDETVIADRIGESFGDRLQDRIPPSYGRSGH